MSIKDIVIGHLGDDPEKRIQEWYEVGKKLAKWKPISDTFEARRKAIISLIKVNIRKDFTDRGLKCTDDIVDTEAHASKQYIDWLKEAIDDKEQYEQLSVEHRAMEKQIDFLRTFISYGKKEV